MILMIMIDHDDADDADANVEEREADSPAKPLHS